jgi:integrase
VAFNKDFFIFGTYKPMSFTTLDRIYKKYITISSVKRIRIHDFRHSFASALIELGVDIMLLAQILGHSSREQIFNTYGHLYPNKQKEAISLLENCCQNVANNNSGIKKAPKIGTSSKMVEIRGIEK